MAQSVLYVARDPTTRGGVDIVQPGEMRMGLGVRPISQPLGQLVSCATARPSSGLVLGGQPAARCPARLIGRSSPCSARHEHVAGAPRLGEIGAALRGPSDSRRRT